LSYDPQRAIERYRHLDEIEAELKTIEQKLYWQRHENHWRAVLARRYLSSPRRIAIRNGLGRSSRRDDTVAALLRQLEHDARLAPASPARRNCSHGPAEPPRRFIDARG
jgi:hypothetical protein